MSLLGECKYLLNKSLHLKEFKRKQNTHLASWVATKTSDHLFSSEETWTIFFYNKDKREKWLPIELVLLLPEIQFQGYGKCRDFFK